MTTRTIVVSRDEAGRPVAALLKVHLRISWSQARRLVDQRRVHQGPRLCRDSQGRVRVGQKLRVRLDDQPATTITPPTPTKKRAGSQVSQIQVRYVDDQVVVAEKPAGLTTMRHGYEAAEFGERGKRFLPATLADLLPGLLANQGKKRGSVIAVHRLDRDTSGLVVFARSAAAARHLGGQFRGHQADRTYLAVVRGRAKSESIVTRLVADRGDGRRGSGSQPDRGQPAITHVRVVETLGDFTLVECCLETGRTHQVRIHLGERGTPICGEHIYDRPLHGSPVPDASGVDRLALHAATLSIEHPTTGKRMQWTAALPPDIERLLKALRRKNSSSPTPHPGGRRGVN